MAPIRVNGFGRSNNRGRLKWHVWNGSMFSWAGVPNALSNWLTVPGFVIRANSAAAGKAAGSAAQAAVKSTINK